MLRDFGDGAAALQGQGLVSGRGAGTQTRQAAGEGSLELLPEFALVGRQKTQGTDAAGRGLSPRSTTQARAAWWSREGGVELEGGRAQGYLSPDSQRG